MDSDQIKKYKQDLAVKCRYIDENAKYAFGENPGIAMEKPVPKPDNRIPIPLGKSAVTDVVGYAGRAGDVKTEYFRLVDGEIPDGDDQAKDNVTAYLEEMDEYNHEDIENSELMYASLSLGIAWELWWIDADVTEGKPIKAEYKILDNRECLPIWDGALKPKLEMFLRFWGSKKDKTEYLDVYYPGRSEQWIKAEGKEDWARNEKGDTVYPISEVPVIPFRTSMGNMPLFHAQKAIIDAVDKIISRTQNEVDRFNALIALFPGAVTSEMMKELAEMAKPFISNLDDYEPDKWPRYLEKNLAGVEAFYEKQVSRLERLFHKTIKVPDFTDESFAGNQSGIAIAYKLIGFEFLVSQMETYFRQGLAKRMDFYFDIITSTMSGVSKDDYSQRITMNRNIPVDVEAKVRTAAALQGLGYSQEAIDRWMPNSIIEDSLVTEVEEEEGGILGMGGVGLTPEEKKSLTVGAMQMANQIINQFALGEISREMAMAQLEELAGLSAAQANRLLGSRA